VSATLQYMPVDAKYGRVVTEFGQFEDDEPVVVFRAKDRLLPKLLKVYSSLCRVAGSPVYHLDRIDKAAALVEAWQAEHGARVPTSEAHRIRVEAPPS